MYERKKISFAASGMIKIVINVPCSNAIVSVRVFVLFSIYANCHSARETEADGRVILTLQSTT